MGWAGADQGEAVHWGQEGRGHRHLGGSCSSSLLGSRVLQFGLGDLERLPLAAISLLLLLRLLLYQEMNKNMRVTVRKPAKKLPPDNEVTQLLFTKPVVT